VILEAALGTRVVVMCACGFSCLTSKHDRIGYQHRENNSKKFKEMIENRVKISNPERVARILSKICQSNLQVFMRTSENQGIAVKGKASNIVAAKLPDGTKVLTLRISNISEQGMDFITHQEKLQVEFIMMATKVVFVSRVVNADQNSILVTFPNSLVSIERRKNARFATNEDSIGYVRMSVWNPQGDDLAAPPIYPQYRDLASLIPVADISLGGVCLVTPFPSISQELKRGRIDDGAQLILPMQSPVDVSMEVRWVKRVKEHVKDSYGAARAIVSYRFGCEFMAQSEPVATAIKHFVAQINQSQAI
jgi:hypothetical protein